MSSVIPQTAADVGTVTSLSVGSATGTVTTGVSTLDINPLSLAVGGPLHQPYVRKTSVTKLYRISAAHHLPLHPGKCRNPHGHNYKIEVTIEGVPDVKTGMIVDFYDMEQDLDRLIGYLDHRDLNLFFETPTAEFIATHLLGLLRRHDPRYSKVVVWETDDCYATASA